MSLQRNDVSLVEEGLQRNGQRQILRKTDAEKFLIQAAGISDVTTTLQVQVCVTSETTQPPPNLNMRGINNFWPIRAERRIT